jgi:large subunit ribosomal protein LP2
MKFISAYLMAYLAGNSSPTAEDLTTILESGNFISLIYVHI